VSKHVKVRLEDNDHAEFRRSLFDSGQTMQSRIEDFVKADIELRKKGKDILAIITKFLQPQSKKGSSSVELTLGAEKLIEKAISGEPLTDCELAVLAENLNLDQRDLTQARNKNRLIVIQEGKPDGYQTEHH
jgi:hypothetical protein